MTNNQILDSLVLFSARKPNLHRHDYADATSYNRAAYQLRKQRDDINELVALIRRDGSTIQLPHFDSSVRLTIDPNTGVVDYICGQSYSYEYRFAVLVYLTYQLYRICGRNHNAYTEYATANFSTGLFRRWGKL
jgi:hypothetical protein